MTFVVLKTARYVDRDEVFDFGETKQEAAEARARNAA